MSPGISKQKKIHVVEHEEDWTWTCTETRFTYIGGHTLRKYWITNAEKPPSLVPPVSHKQNSLTSDIVEVLYMRAERIPSLFTAHRKKKKEKKTYQCLDLRSRWGGQSCFFSAAKMYPVCVSLMWRTNTERRRANGHTRRRRRHLFSFQLFKEGRTLWFFLLFFIAKAATGTTMHFQFNLFVWMEREGTNVTRVLFFGLNKRKEVRAEPQLRDKNQGFSSSVCFIRLWASWWRVCFCSGHKWRRRCVCVCSEQEVRGSSSSVNICCLKIKPVRCIRKISSENFKCK